MSAQKPHQYLVRSLVQQCQIYVSMHLEDFPVTDYLDLLPLSARRDLLWQLPLADVCQLEDTKFTAGLDMAAYWKSSWEEDYFGVANWSVPDYDFLQYIKETEWDDLEYAREMLYGLLTTCAIGNLHNEGFEFLLPHCGESGKYVSVISLLYAVRQPPFNVNDPCLLKFPPRYAHESSKCEEDLTVNEVMNCFSKHDGDLPKIFSEIEVFDDIEHDYAEIVPYYLHSAVYIGVKGHLFTAQGLEFLKAIVKEVAHLEVLMLDNWGMDDEWETEYFDEFCKYLCSYPTFFSNFRLFKFISSMSDLGVTVSRQNFNHLITTYFAAPTNHTQKLQFSKTKIKCSDISYNCSPKIEQKYLSLKTIVLDSCQFVSKYKATPRSISHWLGQDITELAPLAPASEPDTYCFKVEDKSNDSLTRKRKFSELDSEDHNDQTKKTCC